MFQAILLRVIGAQERKLGVSLEYLRHITCTSRRLAFRFAKVFVFSGCRKRLPVDAAYVATLVAVGSEDCGPCLQIATNFGRDDGASAEVLQAVLDDRPDDLPLELAEVFYFAQSVIARTGDEDSLREAIRGRWGEEALIELVMIIAAQRMFPTVTRGLGYAKSCSRVKVPV